MNRYATPEDDVVCREIHKRFGTTYYYSTLRMPERYQRRVHSMYAFVRIPDEWVDNESTVCPEERLEKLDDWQAALLDGLSGIRPEHPAMRAFCDTMRECRIPIEEPLTFLDAMRMDVTVTRYATYEDLRRYMRGSASAIGVMMCYATCARTDYDTIARAMALGEAMQLTNFLRDVGEDWARGRVYLPQEDLAKFGLSDQDIAAGIVTPEFKALMSYEINRARSLYAYADFGILKLPDHTRKAILLARLLYAEILDRIEDNGYDVFRKRARTTPLQKLSSAAKVAANHSNLLRRLVSVSGEPIPGR